MTEKHCRRFLGQMFTRVKQEKQVFSIPFQLFLIYLISTKQITQSLIVFTVLHGSVLYFSLLTGGILTGGILTGGHTYGGHTYGGPLLSEGCATFGNFLNISNLPLLSGFYGNEPLIAYHSGKVVRAIGGWLPQILQLVLPQYHYGNVVTLAVTRSKMY